MAVKVNRPGHHDGRPQGKATEDEGKAIGGHMKHNPSHDSWNESYVNILTGDYHLYCNEDCCGKTVVYRLESNTTYW